MPVGIGAVIKGWNIAEKEFRDEDSLPVVDFRAMTEKCPHDCAHCFTDKNKKTLSLEEIKSVIDQLSLLKTKSIDFLGEGEPTLDKDFFEIIEYSVSKGIQPVVYTDGATMLRDVNFVRRINGTGASIVLKCDSLWNADYQNDVVNDGSRTYFNLRKEAMELLISEGFNKVERDGTTRLGFDMIVNNKNKGEVERTLRFCRNNNIWIIFAFFLPSGRSGRDNFDRGLLVSEENKKALRELVRRIDAKEYGYDHPTYNNFITMPCVEFMQIYGDGRVSPCPGNEQVIGNVRADSIKNLRDKILEKFPMHNIGTSDGHCAYRSRQEL
ncbi:MAG: radical SAM protein [archaeon]